MSQMFDLGFTETEREIEIDALPVRGQLPPWLTGTLVRNGPGTFQVGEQSYRHWFDGLAMLHKFSFQDGRVSYANKFLQCNAYREAMETGRIAYSEFATDPCRSLFARVMTVFSPRTTDSAKVSITQVADHFLALAETPIQVEFDPETLESVGVFSYERNTVGQMTTVHPQFDFERDQVYNVVTRYHRISHYNIYRMSGGLNPQQVGSVAAKQPSYMHSFGMTDNYIILTEFPLVVNPLSLLLWLKPYIENFQWKPKGGTPFWVVNRHTGQVVGRYDSDPFFAFHHINAFERGDELVIDIAAYEDAEIVRTYYLNRLKDENLEVPFGNLRRYRLPLKGKRATYEVVSDECMEMPHFDYRRFNMQDGYGYVYAIGIDKQRRKGFYNQLLKVDVETGKTQTWSEPDTYPGEPIFVGTPGRTAADEGVLLSVVLDAAHGNSFLLALDAHSFQEIARAEIPHNILIGYHGAYFADV
jgi:carotenoid cleavage dioxygenase-like enzyme